MDRLNKTNTDALVRRALEAAPSGIIIVNKSGEIQFVNDEVLRIFKYTSQELIGQPIEILIPEGSSRRHPELRNQYMQNPTHRAMGQGRDLFGKKKDGSFIPVEVGLMPIRIENDLYVVSSVVDLTERMLQQQALKQANEKLDQKSREMEQLLYTVSHDLKAPIVTLSGNLEFLKEDIEKGDLSESPDILQSMNRAILKMKGLIGDLLEISRLGSIPVRRAQTNVDQLLDDVLDELKFQIQESNAIIQKKSVLGAAVMDADRIKQVLENLILNGIKYGANPLGTKLEILSKKQNGYFAIGVRDNGPGIPKEYHQSIFKLFTQLDVGAGGTGVGLSIVKVIAELHGGHAWVESEKGKGATFWFSIKLEE